MKRTPEHKVRDRDLAGKWSWKEGQNPPSRFALKVLNGRYKIYVDGLPMVSFNQLDFKGYYAFKDDHSLYGIDFYLKDCIVETAYKTKEVWIGILALLDTI